MRLAHASLSLLPSLPPQLIVHESQSAILFKDGKRLDVFGAGRHALSTNNIPLLNKLVNLPFGGKSPFAAEVWFVNRAIPLDLEWGTPTPLRLEDPQYGLVVPVSAFGQMGIRVRAPGQFVGGLVGTLPAFTSRTVLGYFKGVLVAQLEAAIAQATLEVHLFRIMSISARRRIEGTSYQQERTFDVISAQAANPGLGAAVANLGAGLAVGQAMGAAVGQHVHAPPPAPPAAGPPPFGGFGAPPATHSYHVRFNEQNVATAADLDARVETAAKRVLAASGRSRQRVRIDAAATRLLEAPRAAPGDPVAADALGSDPDARRAGELQAKARASDVVDAHVAGMVDDGDDLLTSDPDDLDRLLRARGGAALVTRL
jgi:hypothetical protein